MNKGNMTANGESEDIELLQLVLASTRQQLASAMATVAELDARLSVEKQRTANLLEQLESKNNDTIKTSAQR